MLSLLSILLHICLNIRLNICLIVNDIFSKLSPDARTARSGATASGTACTIGIMAPEKSSSATMQKRC
ncbi:MAG: hypothetical protein IIT88_04790, partial [Acetobacter sp.]|nr:hypothetical protein [Acetobacter sp.]